MRALLFSGALAPRRTGFIGVSIGLLLASASPSFADVWSADFNSAALDPSLSYYSDGGYSFATGGGVLTTTYDTAGSATEVRAGGGVSTNFSVDGDFIEKVDIDVSNLALSSSSSPTPFLSATTLAHQATAYEGPSTWKTQFGTYNNWTATVNGVFSGGPVNQLAGSDFTIQLERLGDTMIESVAPAGSSDFALLGALSGAEFLGPTNFTLDAYYDGTQPVSGSAVRYSNFSVTSGSNPSLPVSLSDLTGGSAASPLALAGKSIGSISGNVGPNDEQYFQFRWNGGLFYSLESVLGADPSSSFKIELLNSGGTTEDSLTLDSGDDFKSVLQSYLSPGDYSIGITTFTPIDPKFYITFATPVQGAVPEPSTWVMGLIGLFGLGAVLRRRNAGAARRGELPQSRPSEPSFRLVSMGT